VAEKRHREISTEIWTGSKADKEYMFKEWLEKMEIILIVSTCVSLQ